VAPFQAVVVIAQQDDLAVAEAGIEAYQALLDAGVDVIVDDRPVRAGVKFSDAELVGIPFRITIGKRGLAAGTAEITDRASGSTVHVPFADLPSTSARTWPSRWPPNAEGHPVPQNVKWLPKPQNHDDIPCILI